MIHIYNTHILKCHIYVPYHAVRNATTVETELPNENLHLKDNNNDKDDNQHVLHVFAVVDKKKDHNGSPMHCTLNDSVRMI